MIKATTLVDEWFRLQVESGRRTWLLLEGAAKNDCLQDIFSLEQNPQYAFLFASNPSLGALLYLSPMLVSVTAQSPLVEWFLTEDRCSCLGVFLSGPGDLETTAATLTQAIFPSREAGGHTLCRWQDPQVLCDCMQIPAVFPLVVRGLFSILLRADIAESIGAWVHCEIPEDRTQVREELRIPLSFLDDFHELRETRLLDRHIATLKGDLTEREKTFSRRFHGCDVRILSSRCHGPVNEAEREAVRAECHELQKKYGITDFSQLLDIRTLLHGNPESTGDFDAHLLKTTIPAHRRIALCR